MLFIIFGEVMNKCGMGQFFNDIANALAGHTKGGPAKVAVLASGFLGSINGSAVANVVTTGTFTIPLMKKTGLFQGIRRFGRSHCFRWAANCCRPSWRRRLRHG